MNVLGNISFWVKIKQIGLLEELIVPGIQKQKEVRLEEGQVPVLSLIICVTLGNFLTSNSSLIM